MKNSFNQAVIAHPESVKGGFFFLFSRGYSYGHRSYGYGKRGYSCW